MNRHAHLLLAGLSLLLSACSHRREHPDPAWSLRDGLQRLGSCSFSPQDGTPRVVVIADRHAVHGSILTSDGALREVQKENHRIIAWLIRKEFRLLGCEFARGPLPRDGADLRHRTAVREALAGERDIDGLTVYQPIRYEEEFPHRLVVWGVEDPDLYHADAAALDRYRELVLATAQLDSEDSERRRQLVAERRRIVASIRSHARSRGERAARNLLEVMEERGLERGMLLIGGAHVPAVHEALEKASVPHAVIHCPSYEEALR